MKVKKLHIALISCVLALLCGFVYCSTTYLSAKNTTNIQAVTRTIEVSQNSIDYESIFEEFEDATLVTEGSLTTFEGYQTLNLSDFGELDLVADTDLQEDLNMQVKYNFSFDAETGIVTLSAETTNSDGVIEIDEIKGIAFYNENGEIDAVMNVEGEGILLSEMRDAGMIANCGWFSRLFKKIVVAVVAVVVVAAVAATVVATCGAAAPAVVAAGVGAVGSSASAGIATGVAAATIAAGVGIAIGETIANSREGTKEQTYTDTMTDISNKKVVIFPLIPETFAPRGLIMKIYPGTSNGRFIKWFDVSGIMIFEWDEDLTNGSHYHIMAHDGLHYIPGTIVPEPYASMYF